MPGSSRTIKLDDDSWAVVDAIARKRACSADDVVESLVESIGENGSRNMSIGGDISGNVSGSVSTSDRVVLNGETNVGHLMLMHGATVALSIAFSGDDLHSLSDDARDSLVNLIQRVPSSKT